jgi:hypothetical protein
MNDENTVRRLHAAKAKTSAKIKSWRQAVGKGGSKADRATTKLRTSAEYHSLLCAWGDLVAELKSERKP